MKPVDLKDSLTKCIVAADEGYKIASEKKKTLNYYLSWTKDDISKTITDFSTSKYCFTDTMEQLQAQLSGIDELLSDLADSTTEDLNNLKENKSKFSITLFGRTMAGKSTLMEVLTQGNGASIGKGSQRTTRDVRDYTWNNLCIKDVPGVCAFGGEDDENIAFEAAKKADLIIFLFSDDKFDPSEAEVLHQIKSLGKPIIIVLNIKSQVRQEDGIRRIKKDAERIITINHVEAVKKQFLEFASLYDDDWTKIPFVCVHLKLAFLSIKAEDDEEKEVFRELSRIDNLLEKIVNEVENKGTFYRIKNFIDIISNPIIEAQIELLNDSERSMIQSKIIRHKQLQLLDWSKKYERDGIKQIQSKVESVKNNLYNQIEIFAEEHFEDSNVSDEWNDFLEKQGVVEDFEITLKELEDKCNDRIIEFSREIENEMRFVASFYYDKKMKMHKIPDVKRIWTWSHIIVGGGLSIAAIILYYCGCSAAGPVGWVAAGVSTIGLIGAAVFKSKGNKEGRQKQKLIKSLRKNIDNLCKKYSEDMDKAFKELVKIKIQNLLDALDNTCNMVQILSEKQRKYAWQLNDTLLELNKSIVSKGLQHVSEKGLQFHINVVVRMPGKVDILEMNERTVFPEEVKRKLEEIMGEEIKVLEYRKSVKDMIQDVMAGTIVDNVTYDDVKQIATVLPICESPNYEIYKVLAQQISKVIIVKE